MNRQPSKEEIQMVNKHIKKGLTSVLIRKMQTKTMVKYSFILIRMIIIIVFKNQKINIGEAVEKLESS